MWYTIKVDLLGKGIVCMSTKGMENRYVRDKTRIIARRRNAANMLSALICTAAVGIGFSGHLIYKSYYAVGWHTHSEGTYYISPETHERVTGYQMIDNTCYLFDDEGIILPAGWQKFRGDTYYLGDDGIIQRGTIEIDGVKYYFSTESGIFRTGLVDINGDEYYFDEHGFPGSGFSEDSYFDENGKQRRGWVNVGGIQYYFKNDGKMAVGFYEIDDNVYYFDKDGKMATDWKVIDGKRYLFNEDGVLHHGWIKKDGNYFYADAETGACVTGFFKIEDKTYYFDKRGEMVKNWKEIGGKMYHFSSDGVMTIGWYEEDNTKYYFSEKGVAAKGFNKIGEDYFYFDKNFKMRTGWQTIGGSKYYFGRGGVVANGWLKLESGEFDPITYDPIMLRYYFYPDTHAAAYGWATIGRAASDVKLFKKDMSDLNKFENLSYDKLSALNSDEWMRYDELKEKYKDNTLNKFQKDVYDKFGSDVLGNYYFYSDNTLAYGWITVGDFRFHFDEKTGKKSLGWQIIDGKRYYFGETGAACTGEFNGNDENYVFSSDGVLSDGIVKLDGQIKYKKGDSDWLTDVFHTEGNKTYYFDADGNAAIGWTDINGERYFFNDEGVMHIGVINDDGNVYYLSRDGIVKNKWVTIDSGKMYYFGADGKAYKGWKDINGTEYYFGDDGTLQEGWTTIEEKRYYLEYGVMLRGPIFINGELINLGENGYVTEGWISWSGNKYYNLKGGVSATGWQEIDGKQYYFDAYGVLLTDTVIDGITLGADGSAVTE